MEKIKKEARKGSVCQGCGIYIEWIKTRAGKDMPVDPAPITVITEDGRTVKGFIPHWATCSCPNKFRKNEKNNKSKLG